MKKLTACFITAILMLVSLCACGGMGDKKCSPELGKPFTLSAEIEYEDMRAEAVFTRRDINNWEVEFSSPDTLSGIILTFKDNNVEASYNGLSFSVPKTALPMKSMISAFIGVSEKAAEQGNALAQNNLGLMYDSGKGVSKNPKKAFEWFKKSAENGNHWGQLNAGKCCLNGYGTKKDKDKAIEYFKLSAKQGNKEAGKELRKLGVKR